MTISLIREPKSRPDRDFDIAELAAAAVQTPPEPSAALFASANGHCRLFIAEETRGILATPSALWNRLSPMWKRLLDIIAGGCGLLVLSPLLLLIGLAVKLDSRGPVFYRGQRVGRYGRTFRIYKFRSMVVDAERLGPSSTSADDARITRMGAWIRQHKLDELPQLINVLLGDMSLVGPRPQVGWAVDLYSDQERRLLDVRPGITDYASLHFRDEAAILAGQADPDTAYLELIAPEKTRLGLYYVDNHSLWTDLKILTSTALCVFCNSDLKLEVPGGNQPSGRGISAHQQ